MGSVEPEAVVHSVHKEPPVVAAAVEVHPVRAERAEPEPSMPATGGLVRPTQVHLSVRQVVRVETERHRPVVAMMAVQDNTAPKELAVDIASLASQRWR